MRLPEFLSHLWKHIVDFFVKINPVLKEIGTAAVNVVTGLDLFLESPVGASIVGLLPAGIAKDIEEKLVKIIPKVLEASTLVRDSAGLSPDQILAEWLQEAAKLDHDTVSGEKLTIASKITKELSADLEDGDLSITEATGLAFSIFNGFVKKK